MGNIYFIWKIKTFFNLWVIQLTHLLLSARERKEINNRKTSITSTDLYKASETFQDNHSLSAMCYVFPPTHKSTPGQQTLSSGKWSWVLYTEG